MRNHNPESDLIVILGDMNTMEEDYDGSGNSCMDYLCLRYDNPYNMRNDFIPVNLDILGAVTNSGWDEDEGMWIQAWGNGTTGCTHPGNDSGTGYPDATFDHILLSPQLWKYHYKEDSIKIVQKCTRFGGGPADHFPVMLTLENLN
jgi:exonuclease III